MRTRYEKGVWNAHDKSFATTLDGDELVTVQVSSSEHVQLWLDDVPVVGGKQFTHDFAAIGFSELSLRSKGVFGARIIIKGRSHAERLDDRPHAVTHSPRKKTMLDTIRDEIASQMGGGVLGGYRMMEPEELGGFEVPDDDEGLFEEELLLASDPQHDAEPPQLEDPEADKRPRSRRSKAPPQPEQDEDTPSSDGSGGDDED